MASLMHPADTCRVGGILPVRSHLRPRAGPVDQQANDIAISLARRVDDAGRFVDWAPKMGPAETAREIAVAGEV